MSAVNYPSADAPQVYTPSQQRAAGWAIFPMRPNIKGGYFRGVHWSEDHWNAPLVDDAMSKFWPSDDTTTHNLGVITGHRSKVWVLDVDVAVGTPEEAWDVAVMAMGLTDLPFPETLWVRTASGKWHAYFAWPDRPGFSMPSSQSAIGENIDVRADGGMAMGIGSRVTSPDGDVHVYEVARHAKPVLAPWPLVKLILARAAAQDEERAQRRVKAAEYVPTPKDEVVDPRWEELARREFESALEALRDLSALPVGGRIVFAGAERGWEHGNGFGVIAKTLQKVARWPHCSVTMEEALSRFAEVAPPKYVHHEWYRALDEPEAWEWADNQVSGAALFDSVSATTSGKDSKQPRDQAVIGPDPAPKSQPRPRPVLTGTPAERLAHARAVYRRWLGPMYDLDALHVALAARAAHELAGEPVWVLTLSGSGNAKTEGLMPLASTDAYDDDDDSFTKVVVASEINGPAALLSGSPKKDTAKDATGGLLEYLGTSGVLILKDFTTILSMHRDKRAETLAALREVYDGSWTRQVGTDGGKSLGWWGKVTLLGATTSAYDSHHGVIAAMGDRFALLRVDSESRTARLAATRQARMNTGREPEMRKEMQEAVEAVIAGMDHAAADVDMGTLDELDLLADVVTSVRTTVEFDRSSRNAERAHAPEVGTRFGKMLVQIVRGALSVGMTPEEALSLARRVGRDSAPQIRIECLEALTLHGSLSTHGVATVLNKPNGTVDRALQALQLLGFITHRPGDPVLDGTKVGAWVWSMAEEWKDAVEILGVAR